MVKKMIVDPKEMRRPGKISLGEIPINQYTRTLKDELKAKTLIPADALRIWRDMCVIREFEAMLHEIKTTGKYREISYDHKGPAHLSIGQEAAAVGEAFLLGPEVHIYGSHRSHGEIIAKGLSAIEKMPEEDLRRIMEEYLRGDTLRVVTSDAAGGVNYGSGPEGTRDLAVDFLIYGLLAEIFGRAAGVNRGLGGSMHAFFPPFGIYPNNAIVGGSGDIAVGAALCMRVLGRPGFAIANIGDASMGCGPVWEGLNFATMGQFWTLWEPEYRGGLPIIFAFMNNFYGMGGQTRGETMGFERLACIGAGINPHNLHAETVDGNNPLAVVDAFRRKIGILRRGDGPILLDIQTYRQSGHSPSDASSYRVRDEIQLWREIDPLVEYAGQLKEASVATDEDLARIRQDVERRIRRACTLAASLEISPRLGAGGDPDAVAPFMFSNIDEDTLPGVPPDAVLRPMEENSRVMAITKKKRSGIDPEAGKRLGEGQAVSLRDALFETIAYHMYNDSRLVAYGEENRDWDGAFAVYRGMTESFPYHRLFNAPISEGAIIGTAVGFALEGGRALVELMYADFMGRAGDELFNQLSKWQSMSAGILHMPVVVRVSVGSKYGAQHSQDWGALVAHIPGLKVVFPATPRDAKGLMTSALRGSDPVIFFESQRIYGVTEWFAPDGVPVEQYAIPIGLPEVKRSGRDLTILTIGATLYRALEAADRLERQYGLSAELVDARSLVPFDYEPVLESVRRTGRILLTADACERGSHLNTLAAAIQELAFDDLDAPVAVLGARNWITPAAEMENLFFPTVDSILNAINDRLVPLSGRPPSPHFSREEMLRRHRMGI